MKKLIATALATSMLLGVTAVAPFTVNASESLKRNDTHEYTPTTSDTNRYYFMMPSDWINDYAETCGIYWWAGTDGTSRWPGYQAKQGDTPNVYYMDVPKDVQSIIWNNGVSDEDYYINDDIDLYLSTNQTTDIGTEYYDEGESALYPDGTDSFNNMIYVIDNTYDDLISDPYAKKASRGEWYYYYGNGEYGTAPAREDADYILSGQYQSINELLVFVVGDANNNGTLNVNDVTLIQQNLAELTDFTEIQLKKSDVNKDSKVTIGDVTIIQQYLAEMIPELG